MDLPCSSVLTFGEVTLSTALDCAFVTFGFFAARAATRQVRYYRYPEAVIENLTFDRSSVALSGTSSFAFLASSGRTSLGTPFTGVFVVSVRCCSRARRRTSELFEQTASHGFCVSMVLVACLDGDLVPVHLSDCSTVRDGESGSRCVSGQTDVEVGRWSEGRVNLQRRGSFR